MAKAWAKIEPSAKPPKRCNLWTCYEYCHACILRKLGCARWEEFTRARAWARRLGGLKVEVEE